MSQTVVAAQPVEGWKLVKLPDIALQFNDGPFGSNLKSAHYTAEGVRVIRLQNVGVGEFLGDDAAFISREHYESLPRNHCEPGDVIIATLGDPNLRACVIPDDLPESLNKADCLLLRLDRSLADPGYVRGLLNSERIVKTASALIRGQTRGRISMGRLKSLLVPLPPLAEQKRIAGILDEADALRAKRREGLAQLDTLLQSTFLDMFGDPVTNPMGWDTVKSGELFLLPPRIGTTTPAAGQGYLVVRVGEVGQSKIAFERCGRVELTEKDFEKFKVEPGDTVIARAIGSKYHLGKASFFSGLDEPVVIDSHVMRFRPDPAKCDGLWFYSLISSDRGKVLLQQAGGATAVQFNINAKQASSLPVSVPPLDLQHRFAAIVDSVEQQKERQRAHLAELDSLFASLESRAFRGDL